MGQAIVVGLFVLAAAGYLLRYIRRSLKEPGHGCGCAGCGKSQDAKNCPMNSSPKQCQSGGPE